MPYIETKGSHYYYLDEGQGAPILMLHGFTGSSESWSEIINFFSDARRLIAIDLPGHGKTRNENLPHTFESIASDIVTIIERLDLKPVDLIGYSMGGRLALFLALQYPEKFRSLILESASPGLATAVERAERITQDQKLIHLLETEPIEIFVDHWQSIPLFTSQTQLSSQKFEQQRQQRLNNSPHQLANSLRWMGTGRQPSLWSRLEELSLPTLLLAGALDKKYVAINERMLAKIPDARLHIFPSAGHNIHFEQPQAFMERVELFLKDSY